MPPGFVVATPACAAFFDAIGIGGDLRRLDAVPSDAVAAHAAALQRRVVEAELPGALADAIRAAYGRLAAGRGADVVCAVRSSATAEDLAGASFAGQHGTYYYVDGRRLLEMVRRCWASLLGAEVVAYRATRGIGHGSVLMAVVVQEMVRSDVSGVAFTANPVTGDRGEVVVESSWGMGAALVDGRVTPDRYLVTRDGLRIRERRVAEKRFMVPAHVDGDARLVAVPENLQRRETLDAAQVRAVAEWALRCEQRFGVPQDVEWAIAGGSLHLLQSRPVTALGPEPVGAGVKGKFVLFKSVAENFTDPVTPLTADALSQPLPPGMRFIGGRLYMDLTVLRRFVPLVVSDQDLAEILYLSGRKPAGPVRVSLAKLPAALLLLLGWQLGFGVLMARTRDLPDDFMSSYRALCRRVERDESLDPVAALRRLFLLPGVFDPVGDMALFVNLVSLRFAPWMAALGLMLRRWAPQLRSDAVALLCSGTEGVLSAQMGRAIAELAADAQATPRVAELLTLHEPEDALSRLRSDPAAGSFLARLDAFLAVHGHRGIREFELQSPRWEERPAQVLALVRNSLLFDTDPAGHDARAARARADAAADVERALETLPLERVLGLRLRLVRLAARRARYYFKLRENSRFYHIMGFGAVRKKILAVEAELLRLGKLKCRDDVFYLVWSEVAALCDGRLGWLDVEDRIRERRLEHVRLAKLTPPKTIGIERSEPGPAGGIGELAGQSASPGRYQGVARVILDPSIDAALAPGEVLVAPYTDPAWTPLFLTAGAAVVEVGSYLSHAGTVAREYGMPCVVDVADCTRRIATGARVDVDADRGVVRILDPGGAA